MSLKTTINLIKQLFKQKQDLRVWWLFKSKNIFYFIKLSILCLITALFSKQEICLHLFLNQNLNHNQHSWFKKIFKKIIITFFVLNWTFTIKLTMPKISIRGWRRNLLMKWDSGLSTRLWVIRQFDVIININPDLVSC